VNKESFVCKNCGRDVLLASFGTKNRNHCPFCLCSVHIDVEIGDRANECMGIMRPEGKFFKTDGEEMIVHVCDKCGFRRKNRVAGDDDWDLVADLQVLPAF